jgi:murein DD-endopeptidase MepM/ murein hydrolase activator NlpD
MNRFKKVVLGLTVVAALALGVAGAAGISRPSGRPTIPTPTYTPYPTATYTPSPASTMTSTYPPSPTATMPTATMEPTPTPINPPTFFLFWPFRKGTKYQRNDPWGRDSVVDRDPTPGKVEAYDPKIPTRCSGGVCVADNHTGIDIGVPSGTIFNASANLIIIDFQIVPGYQGRPVGVIIVDYGNGFIGRYGHTELLPEFKKGDFVPACTPFGRVTESDIGASHLHFEIQKNGRYVDPYDSTVRPTGVSLWRKYNEPEYCPNY